MGDLLVDLGDYLRLLTRRWPWVALLLVVCVGGALAATALTNPTYRATAQLFISTTSQSNVSDLAQGSSFTFRQVTTYADLVTAPVVLDPVIETLELDDDPADLAARISTAVPDDTVLINVSVSGEDSQQAAEIANAVADQFTRTIDQLERSDAQGASPVKASLVRPAQAPSTPDLPNPSRNLALGVSLGLMLGIAAAVLREVLDTRVRSVSDLERIADLPVIGGIAFDKEAARIPLVVDAADYSPRAEAFRAIRTNLQFFDAAEQPRSLLITSSLPGEGKSTTLLNLALTLAAAGSEVCVIEADLRRPKLLEYMGLEGAAGLTSVLIGQASLDDVLQPYGRHLTTLGAGAVPPNPSELLGSPAMRTLLTELRDRFEYLLIDAPPLLPVTDAAVLSKVVDGTIMVVGSGIVRRHQLTRALEILDSVDAKILGLLMNRQPVNSANTYGYYYEGYGPSPTDKGLRRGRRERQERRDRRDRRARAGFR
ncbi:polysaccharide biosynthesis tyrosine autokinase [Ornithinimicrobium cryptoxanthini]|uniref:Polysaccharide biosynthesis tyrosine autokinase n=1 Tax=Ornithinimicrobium cryptoxanthini TaxID=2934161 RepID=A0ABY4YHM0_9MICO|nr:polysaccharide biosynthesis tyrosine autokinase [Ornithinimicrobium cryptoxanthini]USQ76114.1 polysaccharide biosynthesis tyrosine autokinase [Ornithinimicrobium cryptoxanthini]